MPINEHTGEIIKAIQEIDGFVDRIDALEIAMGQYTDRVTAYENRRGRIPDEKKVEFWALLVYPVANEMSINQPLQKGE